MSYELIIDILLAVLMAGVIYSAFILNQRITIMRKGQTEMKELVAKLDKVTKSAQISIEELKSAGAESQREFLSHINKAQGLADELSVITQAGDNLADRLDEKLTGASKIRKNIEKENQQKAVVNIKDEQKPKLDEEQEKVLAALKLAR